MKVNELVTLLQDFDPDSIIVFDITGRLSRRNSGEIVFLNESSEVVISIPHEERAFGPTMKVKSPQQVSEVKQQVAKAQQALKAQKVK